MWWKKYSYSDGSGYFEFDTDLALKFLDLEVPSSELPYNTINSLILWRSTKEGHEYWLNLDDQGNQALENLRQDEELREKIIWYLKEAGVEYQEPLPFEPPKAGQGVYN